MLPRLFGCYLGEGVWNRLKPRLQRFAAFGAMHPLSLVTRTETVAPQQLRPAPLVPDAFSTSGGLSDHFAFTESFWRAIGNTPGRLENDAGLGQHSVQSCLPCLACLSAAGSFFLAARCDGGHAANL
ncbi:hypothetical protein SAMN06265222_11956 [Neorhodopirellula lusitana]|uniref:Uncharacterized protein n=1 Tax=Neorhodopirellula lusitana TaxID=445327 RepID=A0ABY1QN55_9BACT|nr:hypothetical protein SAMN06265222_11956 [Neorhodopirellula lusitana]